jgi:DNA polymerase III delta subunit
LKPADVRQHIKSRDTKPLYLLEGDDLQSRHDLGLEFAAVVDEGLQAFNVESFYANEATNQGARDGLIGAVLSTARTLPMMVPRRVIILHEAEKLLSPRRGRDEQEDPPLPEPVGKKKRAALTPAEELEAYFEKPEPMTTMVFVSGPLDSNRRLVKLLRKQAVVVDCGSLGDAREAAAWIQKRLEKDELKIEPKAIQALLDATGLSLGRIRAEVEKLVLYAAGESAITAAHVRDLATPEEEPGEGFAMGDAIWSYNAADALREVAAQLDSGAQPVMVLGQIRAAAIRLRPDSKVKSSLDAVFRTDQALKSSTGTPRHLLECLVVEICSR